MADSGYKPEYLALRLRSCRSGNIEVRRVRAERDLGFVQAIGRIGGLATHEISELAGIENRALGVLGKYGG